MHFYTVPDGRDCREKGQALRRTKESEVKQLVAGGWGKRTEESKVEQLLDGG